ncbi:hypothetical protein U3516DRAFT_868994 [Neocallimastix sp. 'constans']
MTFSFIFTSPTEYTLHFSSDKELIKNLNNSDSSFDYNNIRKVCYLQSIIDKNIKGYEVKTKRNGLQEYIPLFMLFCFVPCINSLLNLLVVEKETRIKEFLVIIGLKRSIFWFSWIVIYWFIIIVSVPLVTLVMHLTNLYRLSDNEFYNNENKKIRYLYLIYNLKFDIGVYEIINFLNSPESIKITSKNDINHKEKSNIITKMFFDGKTPNFLCIDESKRTFHFNFNSIVIVIVFSLILIILEKCKMKYIQQNRNYTEEERKIKNKQLESGLIDVYNEWKKSEAIP